MSFSSINQRNHFIIVKLFGKKKQTPLFNFFYFLENTKVDSRLFLKLNKRPTDKVLFAIQCRKAIGKAHERNRCKRRFKEALKIETKDFQLIGKYIFSLERTVYKAPFLDIRLQIANCLASIKNNQ